MITKIFGENCKRAKVIDVLLSHPHSEYTKKDISEIANIHRNTLDTFFDELIEFGLIEQTRKFGKGHLYKINLNSRVTQALNTFQNQLADIEIEKVLKEYEKTHKTNIKIKKPFEEMAKNNILDEMINTKSAVYTFSLYKFIDQSLNKIKLPILNNIAGPSEAPIIAFKNSSQGNTEIKEIQYA